LKDCVDETSARFLAIFVFTDTDDAPDIGRNIFVYFKIYAGLIWYIWK